MALQHFKDMLCYHKVLTLIFNFQFPSEEIKDMNINRCMRILPHQQDTGGFFVAVLTKKNLCQWESRQKIDAASNDSKGYIE